MASPVIFGMEKRLSGTDPPSTLIGVQKAWEVAQRVSAVTGEFRVGFVFYFIFPTPKEKQKLRHAGDICVFFKVGSELLKPIKGQEISLRAGYIR